jgi:PAS domain S-box-containing protein
MSDPASEDRSEKKWLASAGLMAPAGDAFPLDGEYFREVQRLAAIVASSDDAIIAKDLNGIITNWNRGAERLFGYTANEAVGKPVTILIPPERLDEEPAILSRIRRGERIDHYETVRIRKDGTPLEISLTVSPIRDPDGSVIGASKIARDITERRRVHEQQKLLLREMNHRVKNVFALASSIVTLSARTATTPRELANTVGDRLAALARAHGLTLLDSAEMTTDQLEHAATLHALIKVIVSPFEMIPDGGENHVSVTGVDISLAPNSVSPLALILHEFATNAAKYGALSAPEGRIEIHSSDEPDRFVVVWKERGGPPPARPSAEEGFGTVLTRATAKGLGGEISREWDSTGLTIRLSLDRGWLAGAKE